MRLVDEGSTNSTLLRSVSDWQDHPAWVRFRGQYDPLLRRWCRGYGLDEDSVDEVCQLIWIELSNRMRTFCYDPNGTFRGWLRQICDCRVRDFLRRRRAVGVLSLDDRDDEREADESVTAIDSADTDYGDGTVHGSRLALLGEAEKVQAIVRAKVKPQTWDVFWLVAVQNWTVERTAETLGMTHTAVYAARKRVALMLCEEGMRVLNRWVSGA